MSDLKSENFNLKLRLYHIEERVRRVAGGNALKEVSTVKCLVQLHALK